MSTIDFGQFAEGKKIEVIPEGVYKVILNKFEKCVAKTGTEQIRYYATIAEGEHEGKPLIDHIALSEAAFWRVAWFIKEALNWTKDDMKSVGKVELGSERFNKCFELARGRAMWWTVSIDPTYNNNKVTEYMPDAESDRVPPEELDGDVPSWVKEKGDK